MSIYLGIDFGTATLCVTRWKEQNNQVELVPNIVRADYGKSGPIENVIYYVSDDEHLIGSPALKQMLINPHNFVMAIKREFDGSGWQRTIHGEQKTAVDVASDIFAFIGKAVEGMNAGEPIDGVVVSVPFAFQHRERQKIRLAAQRAGLPVLALIEEPVAAALACGVFDNKSIRDGDRVLVFDFGGGTLDITIFGKRNEPGGTICIEVITTDGHKRLGGKDIDQRIIDKLLQLHGVDLTTKPMDKQMDDFRLKIRQLAEELKVTLTDEEAHEVYLSHEVIGLLEADITRENFNEWIETDLLVQVREVLGDMLDDVDLNEEDIHHIVLVGGSSRIVAIQELVSQFFGKKPIIVKNLDELVGRGAGVYCGMLVSGTSPYRVIQRVSHGTGINEGGKMKIILPRNTAYGEWSEPYPISKPTVAFYQGNSAILKNCSQIGIIDITSHSSDFAHLHLQLGTNENGVILYRLLKDGALIIEDEVTEE